MASRPMPAEAPIRRVRLSSLPHDHLSESGFRLRLITDPPGVTESPGFPNTIVWVHYGTAAYVKCRRADSSHRGMAVHGDIDIIPADTPAVWETKEPDTGISLMVSSQLMSSVAEQCDLDPSRVEIRNRFQVRDPQLENIAWALKAEIECGYPSGRLYLDSLAVAAAARRVRAHSSAAPVPGGRVGCIPDRRLRPVLAYIEENLARDVSLAELATVAGLSVTHLKSLFRDSNVRGARRSRTFGRLGAGSDERKRRPRVTGACRGAPSARPRARGACGARGGSGARSRSRGRPG